MWLAVSADAGRIRDGDGNGSQGGRRRSAFEEKEEEEEGEAGGGGDGGDGGERG